MKHSYLISVQEGVPSPSALVAFPLVKVVDENLASSFLCPQLSPAQGTEALAAVDHVKVFLGIDVIGS